MSVEATVVTANETTVATADAANTANTSDVEAPDLTAEASEDSVSTSLAESVNEEPSHGDAVIAPEPAMNPLGTLAVISLASSKAVDGDFADAVFDADIDLDLGSINPLEALDPKAEAEKALGLGEAEAGTESELSAEPALEDKTIADADANTETTESKVVEPTTEATEEVSAPDAVTAETAEAEVAAAAEATEATAEPASEDKASEADAKTDADSKTKSKAEQQESEPVEGSLMAAFGDDFDAILAPEHHEDKPHKKPKSKYKKSA